VLKASNAPPGAEAFVGALTWDKGFAVGTVIVSPCIAGLRVQKYDPPITKDGETFPWVVEECDFHKDKSLKRINSQRPCKTEAEAIELFKRMADEMREQGLKNKALLEAAEQNNASIEQNDLAQARLKVMREHYPKTFKAMDALAQTPPEAKPGAMEDLFRAYALDLVRLHKPANLGEISPFNSLPGDTSFILDLAKAHNAKSPFDAVNQEIAAQWLSAGYDKMNLAEYTRAINVKTDAKLTPDAMEKRRYTKLGLMTKKKPGPPPKS
jgi:hypothetical protein